MPLKPIDYPLLVAIVGLSTVVVLQVALGSPLRASWIDVLTLALVLVGIAQFFMFYFQLRAMRAGVADAARAADAATFQARLAQSTFENGERPYIFVYGLKWLVFKAGVTDWNAFDDCDLRPTFEYTVASEGKLPAIIEALHIVYSPGLAPAAPNDSTALSEAPIMPAADRRQLNVQLSAQESEDYTLINWGEYDEDRLSVPEVPPGQQFFVYIIIDYRGPFTSHHRTSACWVYDDLTFGFKVYGGAELNFVK